MSELDNIRSMYKSDMTNSNQNSELEKLKEIREMAVEVNSGVRQPSTNEMDSLRKVYADVINEPVNSTDFATFPDGTRANDRELPQENRGVRR